MNKEDLWCEYSDIPSPLAYVKCADYDSMGNHGRFPKSKSRVKKQKKNGMRRIIQKFTLWLSLKFPKKKRKSIWDI